MTVKFSIKDDLAVIEAGGFWCSGCLTGRPVNEQSPDPRYCQGCYDLLKKEAELLTPKAAKHSWIPQDGSKSSADVAVDGTQIMHTVNGTESHSVHNSTEDAHQEPHHRGPKPHDLPDDLIIQWAGEGMGAKAISYRLKKKGIKVHYSTIQRRLKTPVLI